MPTALAQIVEVDPGTLLQIVLRTLVVYGVLIVLLRIFGKRELGQMAPFDFLVLLVIADAVQNGMVGSDTSLPGALTAAGTLLVANSLINRFTLKSRFWRREVIGTPTLLVHEGDFLYEHMEREGVTEDEIMQAVRARGIVNLDDVRFAILESDGSISVIQEDPETKRPRKRIRGRAPKG
jgi:uncharacterized membrane protein YcaP (DUF421 family)